MKTYIKKVLKNCLKGIVIFSGGVIALVTGILIYWVVRPNIDYNKSQELSIHTEKLSIIQSGRHNAMADLTQWNGMIYLAYREAQTHFADENSKIIIRRSKDAQTWEPVQEFKIPEDIRDPKFAVLHSKLFLYVLKNIVWDPAPFATLYSFTEDGNTWEPLHPIQFNTKDNGWVFWRPKTRDQVTWYVPAYWKDPGKAVLFKSTNGVTWEMVSTIYQGEKVNEKAIEFSIDGRLLALARVEGSSSYFGDKNASTIIAVSKPPYEKWNHTQNRSTRMDGPCLFSYNDHVFALGRFQPEVNGFLLKHGSILARKRTSLYRILENELQHIIDLPSSGDTAYGGVVVNNKGIIIAYYTSALNRDYPWFIGMFGKTNIQVLKFDALILNKMP